MFLSSEELVLDVGLPKTYPSLRPTQIAVLMQPFQFVIVHVFLHCSMLQAWQCENMIAMPWAFFHHYVDTRMYPKAPFNYRVTTHHTGILLTDIWFLLLGLYDPMVRLFQQEPCIFCKNRPRPLRRRLPLRLWTAGAVFAKD